VKRLLERIGVLPDEGERLAWLLGHSLLNGLAQSFFYSAAMALFLESFGAPMVATAYIVSALLAYGLVQGVSAWGRRLAFRALVNRQLMLLFGLVALAWWVTLTFPEARAVRFGLFVAIGPLFSILGLEFWGLTSRLFDLRQGKRLFALVGSGEVLTTFLGFLMVRFLLARGVAPMHLLAVSTAAFLALVLLGRALGWRFRGRLDAKARTGKEPTARQRTGEGGLRSLMPQPYFRNLALLMIGAVIINYLVDFNFLTQLKFDFQGEPRNAQGIALFMSVFFCAVKLVELVVRLFLSGLFLNQFGLMGGLLILPGVLLAFASLALYGHAVGTLEVPLFILAALSKGAFLILLPAVFEPSLRVLFQPLQERRRLAFQTHVEGTAKQGATLLSGVGLLLVSLLHPPAPAHLFVASVPVLVLWVFIAQRMNSAYQRQLMQSLAEQSDRGLAVSPVEELKAHLKQVPAEEMQSAVSLLARVDAPAVVPLMEEMIRDGTTPQRRAALDLLGLIRAEGATPTVRRLARATAEEEPDGAVRRTAGWALQRLEEMRRVAESPERIRELAISEDKGHRELAASAIGYASVAAVRRILNGLLGDPEIRVRRAALVAAGRRGDVDLWPRLIHNLGMPEFANAATYGLILVGEPILSDLERVFGKARPAMQARILRIYQHITLSRGEAQPGGRAQRLLLDKLHLPDRSVRRKATIALSLTRFAATRPDDVALIHDNVEAVVGEIAWNLTAQSDLGAGSREEGVRRALELEIREGRAMILLLLSLLYEPRALLEVQRSLAGGQPEAVIFALEVLEMVLSPQLKPVVMPVLEPLTPAQCLRRLEGRFYIPRQGVVDRLHSILHRERRHLDLWPQARALEALMGHREKAGVRAILQRDVLTAFYHPAPLLHEMAAHYLLALAPEEVGRRRSRLPEERREALDRLLVQAREGEESLEAHWRFDTLFSRLACLREVATFRPVPSNDLLRLAASARRLQLEPGDLLEIPVGRDMDVVMAGSLGILADQREASEPRGARDTKDAENALGPGAALVPDPRAPRLEAREVSHLLHLDGEVLFELMADHGELVPAVLTAAEEWG